MKKIIFALLLLSIQNIIYSQNNDWVSISNEYIKVSMDKKTGRFIIYDMVNYYPRIQTKPVNFPKYLDIASLIPKENEELSSILGQSPDVLNFATFNIDGYSVVFGSSTGKWISPPIVDKNSIIYGWNIGGIDIIQTIAITTNIETQFVDAVSISYDVKNTSIDSIRKVGMRLILDPVIGDSKDVPFFLAQNRPINTEYAAFTGTLPNYWIGADQKGSLSPLTIKGFIKGQGLIAPDQFYLTTMNKATENIWEYQYNRRHRLSQEDTAVILSYLPRKLPPISSMTIASTMLAQPSLINKFNDNGLEARISTFTSKHTTPLPIDIWISNIGKDMYDTVELDLIVPKELEIFGTSKRKIHDVGPLSIARSITWNIGSKENIGRAYEAKIQVRGFQNGVVASSFEIPITFDLSRDFREEDSKAIKVAADRIISNISQVPITIPPKILKKTNTITLQGFANGDVDGSSIDQLRQIYRYLRSIDTEDNSEIIKMIETEFQLLREIQKSENDINKINTQYEILLGIYKRLYQDKDAIDRDQLNIQEITDNIEELQTQLKSQEYNYSNISSQFDTPLQFE